MSNKVLARNIQSIFAKSMIYIIFLKSLSIAMFRTHLVHCFKVIAQANLNNGVRYFCFPQGLGGFEGEFLGCKGHTVDACGPCNFYLCMNG